MLTPKRMFLAVMAVMALVVATYYTWIGAYTDAIVWLLSVAGFVGLATYGYEWLVKLLIRNDKE